MTSGIYLIKTNKYNKVYLGSSKNIESRFKRHIKDLEKNKHHNIYLQNIWNKHTGYVFTYEILEVVEKEFLFEIEQMYLDCIDFNILLNVSKQASGGDLISYHPNNKNFRLLQSKLVSERMYLMTREEKINMFSKPGALNGMYNKKHTQETKQKMSQNRTKKYGKDNHMFGTTLSKERRFNLSQAAKLRTGDKNPFYGKRHSNKTKEKLHLKNLGNKPPNQIKVIINNVVYDSLSDAAKVFKCTRTTISNRCKSKSFLNYLFVETSNDQ